MTTTTPLTSVQFDEPHVRRSSKSPVSGFSMQVLADSNNTKRDRRVMIQEGEVSNDMSGASNNGAERRSRSRHRDREEQAEPSVHSTSSLEQIQRKGLIFLFLF